MAEPPLDLRGLVDLAIAKHKTSSMRALEQLAKAAGHSINRTTLGRIHDGVYTGTPRKPKIEALAWLAGVSYDTARAAAGVGMLGAISFASTIPQEADLMTSRQRMAVNEIISRFVEAQKAIAASSKAEGNDRWMDEDSLADLENGYLDQENRDQQGST